VPLTAKDPVITLLWAVSGLVQTRGVNEPFTTCESFSNTRGVGFGGPRAVTRYSRYNLRREYRS